MKSNYTIWIILSTIVVTTTAAPVFEDEDMEDNGEYGEFFEGDMILTPAQREAIFEPVINDGSRNGVLDVTKRWPNRTVIYDINEDDFDAQQLQRIKNAMADIVKNSCLSFRRRENEDEHAVIIQGTKHGCFSKVGFVTPADDGAVTNQVLNLGKTCFRHGTIVHEMLHTLGFHHMHSTYNRDDYVIIVWENIKPGHSHNFRKHSNYTVTDFGVSYDYGSVLHYGATAFSVDKKTKQTIIPIKKNVVIGQRRGLSEGDIIKLNRMYCIESEDKETSIEDNDDNKSCD